jgi:peptidyl-tRNA hydrolase
MSARLSPQRETGIAARRDAATSGSWSSTVIDADVTSIRAGGQTARDSIRIGWLRNASHADTELIAHAPEDIDLLLAELAAVRAERDEARGQLAKATTHVEKRAEFITAINGCHNDADYWRWQGQAEARRQLAEELGLPVAWPAKAEGASS